MKMKFLALSVALALGGVAGTASAAINVEQDGIGHSLVVPYFTTQSGQHTYLNIVNTDTTNGKAVKVRFRGALDSDDIFDFQVFLSPGDVWVADVQPTADGKGTALYTSDNSCTLPKNVGKDWTQSANGSWVPGANSTFVTARLKSDDPVGVKEGYVEIFNMADIAPKVHTLTAGKADAAYDTTANPLFTAIKHVNGVAPCTGDTDSVSGVVGAVERNNFDSFSTANQATLQLSAPTATLFGDWVILNTTDNSAYSAWATAFQADTATRLVYSAQTTAAITTAADAIAGVEFGSGTVSADPANGNYGLRATADAVLLNSAKTGVSTAKYDFPDMSTPYEVSTTTSSAQALALSNSLLRSATTGEFMSDMTSGVTLATDWVFSQPTRRYHVAGRGGKYAFGSNANTTAADFSAYTLTGPYLSSSTQFVTFAADGHGACVQVGDYAPWDRNERTKDGGSSEIVVSPSIPGVTAKVYLCNEAGVVSLNNGAAAATGVLKSATSSVKIGSNGYAGAIDVTFSPAALTKTGWATLSLVAPTNTAGGLPLLGQQFSKFVAGANAAAAGYGTNYDHRFTPVAP